MPNIDAAFGFRPIRRLDGAAWTGNHTTRRMATNAPALNRGDVVRDLGDGYVAVTTEALATHNTLGIFVGCHYLAAALGYPIWSNYWPGSGATGEVDAFIIDDPLVVFEVQALAGPITLTSIGQNADVKIVASATGFSKWTLQTPTTTVTFPFRVVALGSPAPNVGNGYDHTTAYNIVEVAWNDQLHRQFVAI